MEKKSEVNHSISDKFIDQLYALDTQFTDEKGNPIEVQASGFLGLLANGYKGLAMHRKKKGQTHLYKKFTKGKKLARRKQKQPGK
jgi:hypothetical protein